MKDLVFFSRTSSALASALASIFQRPRILAFWMLAASSLFGEGGALAKTLLLPTAPPVSTGSPAQDLALRIWHDQDTGLTQWLEKAWGRPGSALEVDSKADFEATLQLREGGLGKDQPDAVILPNDLIGLHQDFGLSEIPVAMVRGIKRRFLKTVRTNGRLYGVPLLVSDVLVLYYNKRIVSRPVDDLDRLRSMRSEDSRFAPISWPFGLPRYFAPFLVATGAWPRDRQAIRLDRPAFNEAFTAYEGLARSDVIDTTCAPAKAFTSFLGGNSAYAIGPVSELRTARAALKKDLGVAPLPSIHGRPLRPLYRILALVFPFHSLEGAKRSLLLTLARALSGGKAQLRLGREAGRVPANSFAFETLARRAGPGMKVAIQQVRHALPIPNRVEMPSLWLTLDKTLKTITEPGPGAPIQDPGKLAQRLFLEYQGRVAESSGEPR